MINFLKGLFAKENIVSERKKPGCPYCGHDEGYTTPDMPQTFAVCSKCGKGIQRSPFGNEPAPRFDVK